MGWGASRFRGVKQTPVTRGVKSARLSPPRHRSGNEFEFFMEHRALSLSFYVEDALINAFNEPSSIEYIRGMVLVFLEIRIDGRIKFLYLNKYYLYSNRLELLSISMSIMRVFQK